eukprot:30811-Pelagococcus_subviridis.AAC.1
MRRRRVRRRGSRRRREDVARGERAVAEDDTVGAQRERAGDGAARADLDPRAEPRRRLVAERGGDARVEADRGDEVRPGIRGRWRIRTSRMRLLRGRVLVAPTREVHVRARGHLSVRRRLRVELREELANVDENAGGAARLRGARATRLDLLLQELDPALRAPQKVFRPRRVRLQQLFSVLFRDVVSQRCGFFFVLLLNDPNVRVQPPHHLERLDRLLARLDRRVPPGRGILIRIGIRIDARARVRRLREKVHVARVRVPSEPVDAVARDPRAIRHVRVRFRQRLERGRDAPLQIRDQLRGWELEGGREEEVRARGEGGDGGVEEAVRVGRAREPQRALRAGDVADVRQLPRELVKEMAVHRRDERGGAEELRGARAPRARAFAPRAAGERATQRRRRRRRERGAELRSVDLLVVVAAAIVCRIRIRIRNRNRIANSPREPLLSIQVVVVDVFPRRAELGFELRSRRALRGDEPRVGVVYFPSQLVLFRGRE